MDPVDGTRADHGAEAKAAAGVQLVLELVARVPGFEGVYECHLFNEHEVLDHVFFWDVVQETVRSYLGEGEADGPDWREVLAFLEEETRRAVPGALEVIGTSFLYKLPYEGQPGYGIEAHLGPAMRQLYLEIRPWYGAQAAVPAKVPNPQG